MADLPMSGTAGFAADYRQADLWSLVLCAAGIPNLLISSEEHGWMVKVPDNYENAARLEIADFEEENKNWPPPREKGGIMENRSGTEHFSPTILLMGCLLIFYEITGPWSASSPWFKAGAIDGARILGQGEWWRVVTALSLHAGPVHVLGNVLIGGLLVHFLCRSLGLGLGSILILLSGATGNTLNVLLRGGEHHAVGFSTAVFGTIGMLSGLRMRQQPVPFRQMMLPLGAGIGLLAMLGTEGRHTDLGAHLWGFAAGLVMGGGITWLPGFPKWTDYKWLQTVLLIISVLMVWGSWSLALGG